MDSLTDHFVSQRIQFLDKSYTVTKISDCNHEIKTYEREIEAHSVRIAELMKEHEHGILTTTTDKLLIDFVTKRTKRPDSKTLKSRYPAVYADVMKESQSRKVKVSVQPI